MDFITCDTALQSVDIH